MMIRGDLLRITKICIYMHRIHIAYSYVYIYICICRELTYPTLEKGNHKCQTVVSSQESVYIYVYIYRTHVCKRLWTLPVHKKEYHIISQIPIHSQKRLQYIFPNPVFCFHLWQVFWHVLYTCQNTQVTKNQALWRKGYISLQPYMLLLIEKTDILATLYFVNIFSSILNNMSRNPLHDPVHEQNGSEPTLKTTFPRPLRHPTREKHFLTPSTKGWKYPRLRRQGGCFFQSDYHFRGASGSWNPGMGPKKRDLTRKKIGFFGVQFPSLE